MSIFSCLIIESVEYNILCFHFLNINESIMRNKTIALQINQLRLLLLFHEQTNTTWHVAAQTSVDRSLKRAHEGGWGRACKAKLGLHVWARWFKLLFHWVIALLVAIKTNKIWFLCKTKNFHIYIVDTFNKRQIKFEFLFIIRLYDAQHDRLLLRYGSNGHVKRYTQKLTSQSKLERFYFPLSENCLWCLVKH